MAGINKRYITAKVDPIFAEMIRNVARERIKNDIDKDLIGKEQASIRRYTRAMTKYSPLWEILAKAKFSGENI